MAASYSCSPPKLSHYNADGDTFFAKIVDAKAHLDSIQASLLMNDDHRRHTGESYADTYSSSWVSPPQPSNILPHRGLTMPSAPLFWSLFNSLRTDVRSLDNRVGDLEQSVSNLEDRVDHCLDPFTPLSSAADVSAQPFAQVMSRGLPIASRPDVGAYSECFGDYTYPNFANSPSLHSHQKSVELDATVSGIDRFAPYEDGFSGHCFPGSTLSDAQAPEGVAFRDKEISDLEELNRSTQDSLRRSEQASSERQSYIQELEAANAELEKKVSEREECLAICSSVLGTEVEKMRAACQTKDAALQMWTANHSAACENFARKEDELAAANQRLQQMYNLHASKQDELDDVINAKDDELQRLRVFCESKDAVVVKQEEVIARGVILMEQKDDEIERVSRDLKRLKDDCDNETREKERLSRLFEERGEVVAQLRASLNHALTPTTTPTTTKLAPEPSTRTPGFEATYSPFATSGPELHATHVSKWAPKPFKNARLPSEQQRAAIWESGPRSISHTFGRPGWREGSVDARRSDSVRLLEKLALTEESPPQKQDRPRAHREKRSHVSRSSAGPFSFLNDTTQPTLLPPLPPRRRISLAEIRDSRETSEPITKHVSMQDLPRSRLQPYVEAAAEEEPRD
ncbi:hypothetical protein Slin14017_G002490 [Septoria linicola]|nr:hypothetical protein Slin14017_G002490 [Septoria linicola]